MCVCLCLGDPSRWWFFSGFPSTPTPFKTRPGSLKDQGTPPALHMAAQKTGTQSGLPWQVETWTKTCSLPLLFSFEPEPHLRPARWASRRPSSSARGSGARCAGGGRVEMEMRGRRRRGADVGAKIGPRFLGVYWSFHVFFCSAGGGGTGTLFLTRTIFFHDVLASQ